MEGVVSYPSLFTFNFILITVRNNWDEDKMVVKEGYFHACVFLYKDKTII